MPPAPRRAVCAGRAAFPARSGDSRVGAEEETSARPRRPLSACALPGVAEISPIRFPPGLSRRADEPRAPPRVLGRHHVEDSCGWVFCLTSIAAYITEQLAQERYGGGGDAGDALPGTIARVPEPRRIVVSSERLTRSSRRCTKSPARKSKAFRAEKVFWTAASRKTIRRAETGSDCLRPGLRPLSVRGQGGGNAQGPPSA